MNKNSLSLVLIIPGVLLIIAPIISFPYGFYTFLRLVVTIAAIIVVVSSLKNKGGANNISIIFGLITILYNPLIPIHLSREIWMPINFITSGIYFFYLLKIKKIN